MKRPLPFLAWLGVALMIAFPATGGPRGGGGGGRQFSRSGAASSGSFSRPSSGASRGASSGSYTRQPNRSGTSAQSGGQPQSQKASASTQPARSGGQTPGQQAGENQGNRQESISGNQDDRQEHLQGQQDDRQGHRDESREDWQDYGDDMAEEHGGVGWHGGVYVGDWDEVHVVHIGYDDDVEWGGFVAGLVVGTALTASTYQATITNSGCSLTEVTVSGTLYYHCGPTWYVRVMQSGAVHYVVVAAPPGF